MARHIREARIDIRSARLKLPPASKPYWRVVAPGIHLGYRPNSRGATWVVRWGTNGRNYRSQSLGFADDAVGANGDTVLSYAQAIDKARQVADAERRSLRSEPVATSEPKKPYTVRDAISDYLAWAETHTKTASDACQRAEAHILPELGDVPVNGLTASRLRRWRDDQASAGRRLRSKAGGSVKRAEAPQTAEEIRRRRSTANRTLTILKAALNRAWRHAEDTGVTSDMAWRMVEPFENVDMARMRFLTKGEAARLLAACSRLGLGDFGHLAEAALHTGARYGELARLHARDFDADSETVFIAESKSGKPRHVHLSREGAAFFRRMACDKLNGALLFTRPDGKSWGKSDKDRSMRAACDEAGISPAVSFHILRHTWASLAIMNGMPLMVAAQNLGHADTRMVEKRYGHLANSYKAQQVRDFAPTFGEHDQPPSKTSRATSRLSINRRELRIKQVGKL